MEIDTLCEAVNRFEYRPSIEFVTKAGALKPSKAKKSKPAESPPSETVEGYVVALQEPSNDNHAAVEIVAQIRADSSIKKAEALRIAQALGLHVNSKTTKNSALEQILGVAAKRDADRALNEKIRKGA
ncbi:MAG: hypothetical protein IV086_14710 [Hyphomonadaceae bacterium]|nr:hypothetical protein [Hyphomonadaceae bacterium]